jgi:AcrR family transcriptional regulator
MFDRKVELHGLPTTPPGGERPGTMARKRLRHLDSQKREALFRAAALEFAHHGFAGASINRIIQRAGMSKGSVYYYFEDKSDLFATTLERASQRIMEEVGWPSLEVLGADEFWDALLELTHRSTDLARRDEWWVGLSRALHRFRDEPGAGPAVARMQAFARNWWQTLIRRGQTLGVIRTDLPLDLLVEIAMGADEAGDRWMMDRWEQLGEDEIQALVDGRVDLLRDMLDKENEGWEG